jgi:glycosyltransferase involved in cell wall biosynthesis
LIVISLSIIIPTLREAERIGILLQALAAQDYSGPLEIIVVDGGSDDSTQERVSEFPGVRLLVREPPGTAAQRNLGAAQASGELLVFLDADNRPSPQFLSRVARSYQRASFAVACPWFVADSRHPALRLIYFVFNLLFWLSQWRFHTGSGVCVITPRQVFQTVGGFNETLHLGEDIEFIRRAATTGRHRHLLVPLLASPRRFQKVGVWRLVRFYIAITPHLLRGDFQSLRDIAYEAAPYASEPKNGP